MAGVPWTLQGEGGKEGRVTSESLRQLLGRPVTQQPSGGHRTCWAPALGHVSGTWDREAEGPASPSSWAAYPFSRLHLSNTLERAVRTLRSPRPQVVYHSAGVSVRAPEHQPWGSSGPPGRGSITEGVWPGHRVCCGRPGPHTPPRGSLGAGHGGGSSDGRGHLHSRDSGARPSGSTWLDAGGPTVLGLGHGK